MSFVLLLWQTSSLLTTSFAWQHPINTTSRRHSKLPTQESIPSVVSQKVARDSDNKPLAQPQDRRAFVRDALLTAGALLGTTTALSPSFMPETKAMTIPPPPVPTTLPLTDDQLAQIITEDLMQRRFLVTGNLTPHIYQPTATFTDAISTYDMDYWRKGTPRLFFDDESLRLLGDVHVSPDRVEFRYDGNFVFRIPFLYPTLYLSGTVVLTRDAESGLISSYREIWDEDVLSVLKTARF